MIFRVDVDGILCTNTHGEYKRAQPLRANIAKVNRLYDEGHRIEIWTARGAQTGIDWWELTRKQLSDWGVRYHSLSLDKPFYDCLIDDRTRTMP